jgi:UDP-N-acetylglucosamine acyltransferase
MPALDPTARIAPGAMIGNDVSVGPYCVIGPNVVLGDGCRLQSHVVIDGCTTIGSRTRIAPFASLGGPPQSVKYRGGATRLVIGDDCDIREQVTMNIGTEDGGGVTVVGSRCMFMAGSHVAHDCKVGSDVTFANNAVLGGHAEVGDRAVLGGQSAVRQFARVGEGAMIAGLSGVRADIIPFGLAIGSLADLVSLNVVGLRRSGVDSAALHRINRAFQDLFFGDGTFRERLEQVAAAYADDVHVMKIVAFIRAGKSKPLTMAVRRPGLKDLS